MLKFFDMMLRAGYDIEQLRTAMPEAKGITVYKGSGGVELTLDVILKTIEDNYKVLKPVAETLRGATLEQTAYHIWHYLKTQTRYEHDRAAYEEIRTPQRLMADQTGDCDDYSVFSASVLKALGYAPYLWVVAFNGSENYGHIYVGIENLVLDGVMDVFNVHPDHITKAMLLKLDGKREIIHGNPQHIKNTRMIIQQLSGLTDTQYRGFVEKEFNRLRGLQNLSVPERENLNRLKVIKLLEGAGHRALAKHLMPGVAGVDENFNVYYHDTESASEADDLVDEYEALNGLGDVDGLGKLFDKLKAFNKKQVERAKQAIKKTKTVAKKVTSFVKKTGLAPARGAFLLLLEMNFLHMAERLYISYLPEETIRDLTVNLDDFRKLVEFRKKFEDFWVKAGGKKETIKEVVFKRGKKKAEQRGIKGLGVVTAVAVGGATTAASGFLAFFAKAWGAVKFVFSKIFNAIKTGAKKIGDKGKLILENMSDGATDDNLEQYAQGGKSADNEGGNTEAGEEPEGNTNKTLLWLIPAAVAAYFIL
jgi:hypothetical protein